MLRRRAWPPRPRPARRRLPDRCDRLPRDGDPRPLPGAHGSPRLRGGPRPRRRGGRRAAAQRGAVHVRGRRRFRRPAARRARRHRAARGSASPSPTASSLRSASPTSSTPPRPCRSRCRWSDRARSTSRARGACSSSRSSASSAGSCGATRTSPPPTWPARTGASSARSSSTSARASATPTSSRSSRPSSSCARTPHAFPIQIFRPSIVVGERATGWTASFNVLYTPLKAFVRGSLPALPARRSAPVDVVPVDYVADAVFKLSNDPLADSRHVPPGRGPQGHERRPPDRALRAARRPARAGGDPAGRVQAASSTRCSPAPARAGAAGCSARACSSPTSRWTCRTGTRTRAGDLEPDGIEVPPIESYFGRLVDYAQHAHWGRAPVTRAEAAACFDPAACRSRACCWCRSSLSSSGPSATSSPSGRTSRATTTPSVGDEPITPGAGRGRARRPHPACATCSWSAAWRRSTARAGTASSWWPTAGPRRPPRGSRSQRPDAVQGVALGHASVTYDMDGERPGSAGRCAPRCASSSARTTASSSATASCR